MYIVITAGSLRSYTFDTEILCNNDGRLLSNSYRSVIGISSYIAWCDAEVLKIKERVQNMYQAFEGKKNYQRFSSSAHRIHLACHQLPLLSRAASLHRFQSRNSMQ